MPAQATIDISARITGYQTSLNQLRQAINQLDPGSSIRKSLQAAFKNTEGYINKLAKTPVVNVGSDKQLQSLINTLDKASSMVSGISSQLREVRFDDLNADILKDALDDVNKKLSETTDKLNQAANGPQLSTLASKVKNLDTVFNGLGKNIDELGAIEGVSILNDALEESKERAEQAKEALDDVQKRINAWKPPQDTTGLFGSKSGGKGTKLLKELDSSEVFKNIDFDKAGFSQQAIQKLKNNLTEQLKASLQSDYLKQGVSQNIQKALDLAFNQGLNAGNLKDRVGKFADDIRTMLGKKASEMGDVYNMIFGGDVGSKASGAKVADNLLRQITIEMNAGAERLRQIIEVVSNANLAEDKPLIKLVEEGQFETVKQQLTAILQTAKQAYVEMRQLPTGLSDERTHAQERLTAANNDVKNISAVQQQIINTQEYQQAITKIQQLENQIIELRTALSELQAQKVDTVRQTADDVDKAGQSFKVTAEQAEQYRNKLDEIQEKEKLLGKIQGVVERWFSIYAAVRLVSKAIHSMIATVKELDKTITNIAIVTNMSQNDLWQQMPTYTKTAREFAASISGVYEVSQLYYQQGLQTADVMKLTEQTLKMARISGLDYAKSTDYMTNALRSFKMQMQDAQRIVDVYSAVAASSATNVEELAVAMSKTASSAEAVGSSFENTTAMMAVMIEATRQAPENIGSALKSIISRYGELKVNPATLVDSEGQELSLNKVDTALQSVGISIHDAAGQFRDFDDVIMDLAKSWNTIDKNTQRYIATVMAGNRQQSRFLALVSSYQRLKEEAEIAANSQSAAQLQYLKTLDSIEAKQQQLQTSMQSLYTSTGIQNFYKTLIDLGNSVIKSFTDMPTVFNLPIPAILKFGTTFYSLAKLVTSVFNIIKNDFVTKQQQINVVLVQSVRDEGQREIDITRATEQEKLRIRQEAAEKARAIQEGVALGSTGLTKEQKNSFGKWSKIASAVGVVGSMLSAAPNASNEVKAAGSILGGAGNFAGIGMSIGTSLGGPYGAVIGGIGGAIAGALSGLPEAIDLLVETAEEKIERLNQQINDSNNKKLISENDFQTLADYQKRMDSLNKSAREGNDVKAQQIALNAEIAANYPELIKGIDEQGNIVVDLNKKYEELIQKKRQAYSEDIIESGKTRLNAINSPQWIYDELGITIETITDTFNVAQALIEHLNDTVKVTRKDFDTSGSMNTAQQLLSTFGIFDESDLFEEVAKQLGITITETGDLYNSYLVGLNNWLINNEDLTITQVLQKLSQAGLNRSDTDSDIADFATQVNTFKQDLIDGVKTDTIASLRKSYDRYMDKDNLITGIAGAFMNQQLENSLLDYQKKHTNETLGDQLANWSKQDFFGVYDNVLKLVKANSDNLFTQLDKYYKNIETISKQQYNDLKTLYGNTDLWSTFQNKYNEVKATATEALKNALTSIDDMNVQAIDAYTSYILANYSLSQLQKLSNIIPNLNSINQLANLLSITDHLTEENRKIIFDVLQNSTLDTISGLETVISNYSEQSGKTGKQLQADPFIVLLKQLENSLSINFNTEYQLLTDKYTEHLKQLDKALKNATSGMDNQEATKLAAQLKTTLSDPNFRVIDGKWYYDNIKAIYDTFMPDKNLLTILNEKLDEAFEYTKEGSKAGQYSEEFDEFIKAYEESGLTWEAYIKQLRGNITGLQKMRQQMAASAWLDAGNITQFINSIGTTNEIVDEPSLYQALISGTLTGEYEQYVGKLFEYYQAGTQQVYDAAVKLLSGQAVSTSVKVTASNKDLINSITNGSYEINDVAALNIQQISSSWDELLNNLSQNKLLTFKQKVEQMAKFHNAGFEGNTYDAITSVIKSFEEFDISQALMLPQSLQKFVDMNKVTGKYFINLNAAAETLNDTYLKDLGWDNKQINELQATIRKSQRENDIKTIASDIVKNRESLTEENIASIATALDQTYDEVIATLQLQRNQDGTYRMNMNSILQLMNQKKGQLDTVLAQMIAEEIDNIIGNVSNIVSDQGKGTTKFADMQKAVTRAQEAGFKVETVNDLYEWDEAVRGYVLKSEGLFIELAQARMELESLGKNQQQARDLLQYQIDSIGHELANNVDITKYISSPNNWNQNTEVFKNFKKSLEDLNKYFEATGQAIYNIDIVMSSLRQGGIGAVNIAQQIAKLQGIDLSNDDINKIFRTKVDYILEANDQLTAAAGEIISQDAGNFLNAMQSGAQLKKLENGSYLVIKSAEDLTKAYSNIYDELAKSGQATVEQLNRVAAQYFNAQAKTSKLDTLHDIAGAAELTYDELADLFTQAGWSMSTNIFNELKGVIENLDNGKARILNFSAFADALGIDKSTNEYFKALQEFNDNLIDSWNDTRNHVAEQIEDLSKAGPGDLVNVTQLQRTLGDKFTEIIEKYGGFVSDGILQVTTGTKMPDLIKEITTKSAEAGNLFKDEVKHLIDVVNQLYKNMADAIVDGMKGGLSNADANYLKTQAKSNFGLDINFTQSYQGLKLSTDQAIKLYSALKQVDTVSSHIVFEELTEQLTKAGQACESMSRAMAEIARLEEQVAKSTGKARKEAEQQLSVYKEIANLQLNNPDAYDFMGNALPDYLKGPENYWNSLGKAFKALNEAAQPPKEGALGQGNYLDITDFYNIVNEFNNLAQLGGEIEFLGMKLDGSLESASALIQKGMNTLTNIDGQGVKIDLSKIGASFTGGAEGMAKGVDQGIKEMAKSQIKMLDGMIQLLETVVAMEGLKDVADDTGDENVIDLTDIFPKIEINPEDFTVNEKIISWIDKLFASDNQDLQKALTNVKFGTKTLKQILTDLKNGSIQSKEEAEQAQQALNALYQMYLSGDYSLQNLIGSIKQVLGSSGYEGQVQVGDTKLYISQGFVLEHGKQGWQVPGVGSFTNVNDALSAYKMQTVEGAKNAKTKGGITTAELVIGSETVNVVTTKDSLTYLVGNKKCKTYNEAAHEAYKQYVKQFRTENSADAIPLDESQWRVQNNVILESSVNIENPEQVKNATHKQIQELAQALVSGEDIEAKAQAVGINVKIQGDITQADFQKIASAAGIDTKTLALSLTTEVVGNNADNVKKILAGQNLEATVNLTGEFTNLNTTQNTLTYDEQVSVTLANIKAMATADNINWDGITTLINTVPEDKRPSVEAQAKQYIIKALEGNPEYQGFPTLLTGLQGLPIPALQATATVMSILWGGGAKNVTNATGLTEKQINILAATLDFPDTMLEVLATLVQITDGGVVPEESAELAAKLTQLFPDNKYTTDDIKAITLVATAAAVMLNGKGVTATGEFDDKYEVTDKVSQVSADIIKLIVSTNDTTKTEKGTTFNADNWQGTIDKINAVAALLEVGLQTNADINVDGTNIPSTVATTQTIETLRTVATVLQVALGTGAEINLDTLNATLASMVQKEEISPKNLEDVKVIIASLFAETTSGKPEKPSNLENIVDPNLSVERTVKVKINGIEYQITQQERAYRELRDILYKTNDNVGYKNSIFETQVLDNNNLNVLKQYTRYLNQAREKTSQGTILSEADVSLLTRWKNTLQDLQKRRKQSFGNNNDLVTFLFEVNQALTQNEINISDEAEQLNILNTAFKGLDPTILQECATAMAQLAGNTEKLVELLKNNSLDAKVNLELDESNTDLKLNGSELDYQTSDSNKNNDSKDIQNATKGIVTKQEENNQLGNKTANASQKVVEQATTISGTIDEQTPILQQTNEIIENIDKDFSSKFNQYKTVIEQINESVGVIRRVQEKVEQQMDAAKAEAEQQKAEAEAARQQRESQQVQKEQTFTTEQILVDTTAKIAGGIETLVTNNEKEASKELFDQAQRTTIAENNSWNNIKAENAKQPQSQVELINASKLLSQYLQTSNTRDMKLQQYINNLQSAFDQHQSEATARAYEELLSFLTTHYADTNVDKESGEITYNGQLEQIQTDIDGMGQAAQTAGPLLDATSNALSSMPDISSTLSEISDAFSSIQSEASAASGAVNGLQSALYFASRSAYNAASALYSIPSSININLMVSATAQGTNATVRGTVNGHSFSDTHPLVTSLTGRSFVKGNALAKGNTLANGTAAATGKKTLMGELGPELVVSNGRYFVVGQAGAEFVDLDKDAIVFNHLQTRKLLSNGRSGRGKPVTNERTATSRAKGTGDAMASASAALAALKQIRAMWQSMLNASMKDLGSLAGQQVGKAASKSGGGGSSSAGTSPKQLQAVVEEIERWYNLVRDIDRLQKDITYQQNLQAQIISNKVADGRQLYRSYKQQINYLDEQIAKNQELADLQKSWYERKRNQLVNSDYGKIFTYDENGQLKYRHGNNLGLDVLEKLTRRDIYGQTSGVSKNARTQINYLRQIGFDVNKLKYNDDGTRLSEADYEDDPEQIYVDMMQNYWDRLEGWKDELDSIYDSYRDQLNNVLTNQTKRNQILQKIVDNQLSVQQDVLKAIESREQKLINELQDERDALERSTKSFIDGLNKQLNQQKEMYKKNQNEKQLVKLRRQLAILQRSGGSSSLINNLQSQIASKEQDQYFSAQQQQINAIQQASDLQIERLDAQIDLMTETLEYQKEHGLLWEEVYQVMASTPQQIRQFIAQNTPDFQSASALDVQEKIRDLDLRIREYVGYRDDDTAPTSDHVAGVSTSKNNGNWNSYYASRKDIYGDRASDKLIRQAKQEFERVLQATGDADKASAAADAIFRDILGDGPGATSLITGKIITGVVDAITDNNQDKDKDKNYNYGKDYYRDDYDYDKYNNNKKKTTSTTTSTSSTSSNDKKEYTFSAAKGQSVEQQQNILKLMKGYQNIIDRPDLYSQATINSAKKAYNNNYDKLNSIHKKLAHNKYYKEGGLVNYTGLAQVDGTPQRPEAFLNAEQTELLRKHLFGESGSLLSLAQSIAQQLHGISYVSDTNYQEENSGINIENIDVNVNVKQIANDYDVRSIGDTVMNEMLTIARKSGTRGLSRR